MHKSPLNPNSQNTLVEKIEKTENEINEFTENLFDTVREPLLAIDKDLRVIKASRSFYNFFKVTVEETIGKLIYELGNHQWDIPKLKELLEDIIPEKNSFDNYEVEHNFSTIGKRVMLLNARQVKRAFGKEKIILLAIEDIAERKGKEDSLKETHRTTSYSLNILMDLMNTPIIIWDTSMIIKRFNRNFELLSGYDSAEVIGRKIDFLFPNDKIAATLELLKNHLDDEHLDVAEIAILTKDNHIKTVLWNSSRILDEEGKNIIATISQDITSRRQSELALRKSESHLRTLVKTIPDLIWLKDTNGVYLSCNPMFERFFGAREAEIIGKTDSDFVDRKLADIFLENDRKAMDSGSPTSNVEWVTFADDGHRAFLDTIKTPIYDSDGTLLGVLGIGRDLTERKKSEDALFESEIKYRTFFENSMDAILLTNPNGEILSANQASCNMFGYSEDELIELGRSAIVDMSDPRLSVLLDDRKIKGKAQGEVTFLRKDRTPLAAEISSVIFKNQEGFERTSMIIRNITDRKRTEEALRKSEQLYRSLFENMLNGYAYCKMIFEDERPHDFIYLAVNKSFEIQTGLKDVIGKKVSDVIPGARESDPVLFEVYGRVALTGKPETIEIYVEALKMWLSVSVYSPEHEHFVATFDVIDKRKNAEEVLRQNEAKFRKLINSLPDSVFVVDSYGRIVYCNENAMKTFDYTIDEIHHCTIEDLIPKPFKKLHITLRNEYISEPKSRAMGEGKQLFAQRKGGSEFPTEIMLDPVEINGNQFTLAIVRDITGRKKIEQEIKFQADLINIVGQSVIATDLSGKVIYWNNAAEKIYGWSPSEAIGENIMDLIQPSEEQAIDIMNTLSAGNTWAGEFGVKRKDGSSFPAFGTNTPMFNSNGKLNGFIGISQDITERKRAEIELVKAKEKAEESDRLKSAFLANMSHEIRTPMNGILGFTELLLEPDLSSEQKEAYINIVNESGKRMLNTVNDIIEISKIEAGIVTINLKEVDVQERLDEILRFFNPVATKKGLKLTLENEIPKAVSIISTDQNKIDSILTNLIKNAINYTQAGEIKVGSTVHEKMLEFYIKDTGIGIPDERQQAVFVRFIKADILDKDARQGSGLGLAITKAYVEMLGGEIRVESIINKGSTFFFTLPLNGHVHEMAGKIESGNQDEKASQIKGLHIVIAEDDETSVFYLQTILQTVSSKIILTKTGNETVEACRNNPDIDLVLMDIQMPEMNGYDATREIRKFNKNVIIIAQTAFALSGDYEKAIKAGCNDYIAKPIKKRILLEKIRKFITV